MCFSASLMTRFFTVCFFFTAILLLLFRPILRTLNWALGSIKTQRLTLLSTHALSAFQKLMIRSAWKHICTHQCLAQGIHAHKKVLMGLSLIHTPPGGVIFLSRIVLQIRYHRQQQIFGRRKNAITSLTSFPLMRLAVNG